jgi:hypothetical protein
MIRIAKAGCRLSERIEHHLQIEGGPADDLEHVGGGGLLLQRLAQLLFEIASARVELLYQCRLGFTRQGNARTRLRSGRTKLANVRSAFRALARRGHLNRPHAEDQALRD